MEVGVVQTLSIERRDRDTLVPPCEAGTSAVRMSGRRRRRDATQISSAVLKLKWKGVRRQQTHSQEAKNEPLKYLPNFIANGKGIFDVKLKHIVSRINLSMASNLCLSDSRA